jgi:2-hydroxychromene-2-carboxylate isomerase
VSQPVFYYDLTDPISYLAAERIHATLAVVAEWEPVLAVELGAAPPKLDPEAIAARAQELGLLPFRWLPRGGVGGDVAGNDGPRAQVGRPATGRTAAPDANDGSPAQVGGPATGRTAALAATYAKRVGRVVAFSLAAFRQAFAGGHDLDLESTVLLAGAACELHPRALLQAIERPAIGTALQRACDRARLAGVVSLPAIEVRGSLFSGSDAVEQAAEIMKPPGDPPRSATWPPTAPHRSAADL